MSAKGRPPAIVLLNPQSTHSVELAIKAASCFNIKQVWFTDSDLDMRQIKDFASDYPDVELHHSNSFLDYFDRNTITVSVGLRQKAESLPTFAHPNNAVYIFGPEDGIGAMARQSIYKRDHNRYCVHVTIPTKHYLNVDSSIHVVLYDRMVKRTQHNLDSFMPVSVIVEERG